jgi:hypothetical protein
MMGLLAVQGISSTASALSLNLEFAGGATSLNLTPADISSTHTVSLFADLTGGGGGGVFFVAASVNFSSTLTPLRCKEQTGTFNNGVGGVSTWGPLTFGCGDPPGGISGQNVQTMEQAAASGTVGGTFGKLKIATITFHVNGLDSDTITPFFLLGFNGFLQNDGTTFTSTAPVFGAIVNVIPEPTTALLLGMGVLGLGFSGRRLRGRRSIR